MSLKRYEYKCLDCDKRIDIPADVVPPETCAYCGGKMGRVFGTQNIIWKGYEFVGPTHHEKRDR